jgi:hypothetical protein
MAMPSSAASVRRNFIRRPLALSPLRDPSLASIGDCFSATSCVCELSRVPDGVISLFGLKLTEGQPLSRERPPRRFPATCRRRRGAPAGVGQHHRCATWRQRDRIGLIASAFGYALTVGREQSSQDGSVQVPRFGPRRLKRRRRNAGWLVVHPWFTFILRVFPRSDQARSVFSALRQAADLRSCLQFG